MRCNINGQPFTAESDYLSDILTTWGAVKPFVVAVNNQFVPSHQHDQWLIKANDNIDILSPIQGG